MLISEGVSIIISSEDLQYLSPGGYTMIIGSGSGPKNGFIKIFLSSKKYKPVPINSSIKYVL